MVAHYKYWLRPQHTGDTCCAKEHSTMQHAAAPRLNEPSMTPSHQCYPTRYTPIDILSQPWRRTYSNQLSFTPWILSWPIRHRTTMSWRHCRQTYPLNILMITKFCPRFNTAVHGFRKKKSTTTNLVQFWDNVTHLADQSSPISIIYTDIRKAFDSVAHDLLLQKLLAYGIQGKNSEWLRSCVTNRRRTNRSN